MMVDDPEFNIAFVGLIKQHPCLYDHSHSDYTNRAIQDNAWDNISKLISKPKNDCKERWKNLRGCYTRHLKILATPSSPGMRPKKTYYLAEHLEFLKPFTKRRKFRAGFSQRPSTSWEHMKGEYNELYDYDSESEDTQTEKDTSLNQSHEASENHGIAEPIPKISKEQPKSFVSLAEINKLALEYFRSKRTSVVEKKADDADLAFFTSVLTDMREMNNDQKRRFKIGILTLAGQILKE